MTTATHLDAAFTERQRQRLLQLQAQLRQAAQVGQREERETNAAADAPREPEDDAQRLSALEVDGSLVARDAERLSQVERALRKIDEHTYGISDISGKAIPRERLEAIPEATTTVGEARKVAG